MQQENEGDQNNWLAENVLQPCIKIDHQGKICTSPQNPNSDYSIGETDPLVRFWQIWHLSNDTRMLPTWWNWKN